MSEISKTISKYIDLYQNAKHQKNHNQAAIYANIINALCEIEKKIDNGNYDPSDNWNFEGEYNQNNYEKVEIDHRF